MPFCACSRPPLPSDMVANHDPSGGVPADAITVSFSVTLGRPSIRLTVTFVCGVKVVLAAEAYHWLCPVSATTGLRVRTSIVTGPVLAAGLSTVVPLGPQAAAVTV